MNGSDTFHMSKNLYGFAFEGLPAKMLYRLRAPDMCYIVYSNNINHYLKMLIDYCIKVNFKYDTALDSLLHRVVLYPYKGDILRLTQDLQYGI